MPSAVGNPEKLDPRVLSNADLIEQLRKLPGELPATVWLPDHGMAEVVAAVVNTIYIGGRPRPAVGLVTARES